MQNFAFFSGNRFWACLGFIFLSLIAALYWSGLNGDFALDDFGNIPPLFEAYKANGFWYAAFSGNAGPLGRPLTLLTLLLQYESWPHPYTFKFANLVIHLANTGLVFWLSRLLIPYLFGSVKSGQCSLISLGVAFVWAILPIQVSTVLYVIQRMVLLSTFFMLAGMITYFYARHALIKKSYFLSLSLFVAFFAIVLLAILSKESGLLIFAYLVCIELLIATKSPIPNKYWKWMLWGMLCAPLILFCLYLYHIKFYQGYAVRPFTLTERLLSESRVVWIYIHQIILPEPRQLGLYQESFPISRSLFNPISTLISCAAWFAIFVMLIWALFKKKVQLYFPCLWFFAGHLMESTVISLELYFEHRNYLASLGIVFLGLGALAFLYGKIQSLFIKRLFFGVVITYLAILITILKMQTNLWGSPLMFNYVHATERTESIRARSLLVSYYQSVGNAKEAYIALETIEKDFPAEPAILFLKLQFTCVYPNLAPPPVIRDYTSVLQSGDFSNGAFQGIDDLLEMTAGGGCKALDRKSIFEAIALLKTNKSYSHKYYFLARFESMLHLQNKNLLGAIDALASIPNRGYEDSVGYARLLASVGEYKKALLEIDSARKNIGSGFAKAHNEQELKELSETINNDIKLSPADSLH